MIWELIPSNRKMAMSHAVRTVVGITNVIPKYTAIRTGKRRLGTLASVRKVRPIRIPEMVAPSAGTRGRENIEVTGYSSKGLASGTA